jgi:hypothetical protein
MSVKQDIKLEFDKETQSYYIIWQPVIISLGKTRTAALQDLREAAHFGVDNLIDLKLKDIRKGDKSDG